MGDSGDKQVDIVRRYGWFGW